ncbi:sensor histidine kinase [Parafrankia discariae]|uniref:sensor histidine kinase n=1 Tax=Parafrankia discariae TaxID=365528 RepID=UPI0003601BD6|nr:sensor histidine kinase [Parafrankia discariae]
MSTAEPPDVPGVVFGRMRHGPVGRALRAHPVLVDSALAAALGLVILPPSVDLPHPSVRTLLLTVASIAPLCLRRRHPIAVFAVCAAAGSVQLLLWIPSFGTGSLLIAFYTVAARRPRRQVAVAAAALTALIVWFCVSLHGARLYDQVGAAVFLGALGVTAGVLGVNVNTRRAYLTALADRAARLERDRDQQARLAAARERARIAREMHDIVAHNLSVMIALADGATFALRGPGRPDPASVSHPGAAVDERMTRATRAVESVSATGREALAQMRGLLGVLRDERTENEPPPGAASAASAAGVGSGPGGGAGRADPTGPAATAPQPGTGDLDDLIDQVRQAGLTVRLTSAGPRRTLTADAELTVFRIVQESLTNVLKHGGPGTRARVLLRYDAAGVEIEIVDDGRGVPATGPPPAGGRGVQGMRERAALHGGTLTAGPVPGRRDGWRVTARIRAADSSSPAHPAITDTPTAAVPPEPPPTRPDAAQGTTRNAARETLEAGRP